MTGRRRETAHDAAGGPLADLSAIAEALEAPEGRAVFLRGATIGVLAGAALVGAIFQLRRSTRRAPRGPARD